MSDVIPAVLPHDEPVAKRRRWKLYAIIAGILALALAATGFGVRQYLHRATFRGGENLAIPGLIGPVRVTMDNQGVPRIFADHSTDLFRAQGYLDASQRFFQMDYRRHVASGTLAELIGGSDLAITSDRVVRTMGWPDVAAAEWELTDPQTRSYLEAYAEGINAYLASRTSDQISLEYGALRRDLGAMPIRPWKPVDSLAWLKVVAWEMRSNFDEEMDRTQAFSTLQNIDSVNRLFPEYNAGGNPTILQAEDLTNLPSLPLPTTGEPTGLQDDYVPMPGWWTNHGALNAVAQAANIFERMPRLVAGDGATGSNSWVISGKYTESGKPIVANDPHMALTVPSVFSQVGLFCNNVTDQCPFNVTGFSLAGFPGVYVGHNGHLAWGLTNLRADTADLFVERVHGDDAILDSRWRPMATREEVINVAGGAPAIPIIVRTIDGRPVLSDIYDMSAVETGPTTDASPGDFAVSLAWSGLVPGQTAAGLLALNKATDAADVETAAALITAPTLAIVFGTSEGDIGFQSAGLIPVRGGLTAENLPPGATPSDVPIDGTWPQDGRHSANNWQGWVAAADMPRSLNPDAGFIVAANQAVTKPGVGPYLGSDFDYGFRAARITYLIEGLIERGEPLTVTDSAAIQFDDLSPAAAKIVPVLRGIHLESDWDAAGQNLLSDWDSRMSSHSPAAAYFASAWNHVMQLTFWDELPEGVRPDGTSRWLVVLSQMLNDPTNTFWDDRSTLDVTESRDEVLRVAMLDARNELTTRVSSNPVDWHWGALHQLRLISPVTGVDSSPRIMRWLSNPPATATSGSTLSVNSTAWPAALGEMGVMNGPAFRVVMDTGYWDNSLWVNVPGNSGHIRSAHYHDQLQAWTDGDQFPFRFANPEGQRTFVTFAPN